MKSYNINFDGYYINKEKLPFYAGIYLVYQGQYDRSSDKVKLSKLLYIGESDNICVRHENHEHEDDFQQYLCDGKILIYSTAKIEDENDRKRIENALIFHHRPPINDKGIDTFNYYPTNVNSAGACRFIDSGFTVY